MEGADTIDEEVELCNQPEHSHNQEDSFVWDDNSQLYFHARFIFLFQHFQFFDLFFCEFCSLYY